MAVQEIRKSLLLNKDLHKLEFRKKDAIIYTLWESLAQKYLKTKGSESQLTMNIFTN